MQQKKNRQTDRNQPGRQIIRWKQQEDGEINTDKEHGKQDTGGTNDAINY